MASRKPIPDKSKIARERPLAYSRRQKPQGGDPGDAKTDAKDAKTDAKDEPKVEAAPPAPAAEPAAVLAAPGIAPTDKPLSASSEAPAAPEAPAAASEATAAASEPPAEPWPDATPQPMRPVEPARARAETTAMPAEVSVGAPPAVPVDPGTVEDPTYMPGPREIPQGGPGDPASPPGRVPPGDSRSLRKDAEFALVYRVGTCVISRFGTVGTRGQWRVVDYPTSSSASNAYAKECSRFVSEGFSDYRD